MAKQETAATAKVWDKLMATSPVSQPFELGNVYEYLQYLLNHNDVIVLPAQFLQC